MKKIIIKSNLMNYKPIFDTLMLAHLSNLPVLIYGDAGTGKTQACMEFCNSLKLNNFFIQLNYDTNKNEILGYIDISALIKSNELKRINGINENTNFLLIDEIDKANSFIKNLFLSILREKKIFNGKDFINLNENLTIIGTSNTYNPYEIDADEKAFYDRFAIKKEVIKIDNSHLIDNLIINYDKEITFEYVYKIKDKTPHDKYLIIMKLFKALDGTSKLSNRMVTYLDKIVKSSLRFLNTKDALNLCLDIFEKDEKIKAIKKIPPEILNKIEKEENEAKENNNNE